jgi:hypothetical protein
MRYSCVAADPTIIEANITVKFLSTKPRRPWLVIAPTRLPLPKQTVLVMDEFGESIDAAFFKGSRKAQREKGGRKNIATSRKSGNSVKLSEAEQDYCENAGVEDDGFVCLDVEQLLDNLEMMNFTEIEGIEEIPEELVQESKKRRKKRQAEIFVGPECYQVTTFNQLNRDIKLFIKDNDEELFEIGHVPPSVRRIIHQLADLYHLKTFSVGKDPDRRIVLCRTEQAGAYANVKWVDKVIESGNKALKWADKEGRKKHPHKQDHASKKESPKPAEGAIVASGSAPISSDNVGNVLLQKMGWQPGQGLGKESDGIKHPIGAVVKTKRAGLV